MRISDPNKLVGKIMKIKPGHDITEVIIDIGDRPVTATVTNAAAEAMNLAEGNEVFALFNSTDVTIIKDSKEERDYGV
ncbi:MAG: TOBE domain-containing protein [Syntrophomonadaceae bacterium]|jgi:molybdopterin-binding protein